MAHILRRQTKKGEPRYDVRWRANGKEYQRTFLRSADAANFKREIERQELTGNAFDPKRGEITVAEYANQWLHTRRRDDGRSLAPRTMELYRYLLDRHILPSLGDRPIGELRVTDIRTWHNGIAETTSHHQAAKAYRLLRAILNTAVEDERLISNPCKIRGAGQEHSAERPFVDADIVLRIAQAIEERYSALILLAGFGGLRLGELLGLRRRDVDLERSLVRVEVQVVELKKGERLTTPPKTAAGRRSVALPKAVMDALALHLTLYSGLGPDAPVFTGPLSDGLRRATFYTEWAKAMKATGQQGLHLHDLRHAAGTLAAQQGATVRELMARLGHASPAAAHRYQHAAWRRDAVIADALQTVIEAATRLDDGYAKDMHITADTHDVVRDGCGMEPSEPPAEDPGNPVLPGGPPRASDGNRTRVLSLGS